jgi:ATP-binding cassette subfamily B protein
VSIKKDKINTKQSFKQVWSNNWFLLKLCYSASPIFIITITLDQIRNQVSIFFEHTLGIGYVLEAAEFHYPFRRVAAFILILAACITLGMVFTVLTGNLWAVKGLPKVRRKVKMALYEKAKEQDLERYDNPEYYNELVLAISEADKQIDRLIIFLQNTASGISVFISSIIFFVLRDKSSVLFAVVSFVLAVFFNQMYNKLSYKVRIERNPFERKREYVKRVFYLNDYAKEIRLNPEVSDILFKDFEKANDEVYKVEKSYANRRFLLGFMRRYASNELFSDVLYISYLVYKAAVIGTMSYSSVAILYNSFGNLKRGMRIFTDIYPYACETSLYVQKIRDFLDSKPMIVSDKQLPVPKQAKAIELKNVSFAYNQNDKSVINNVSLSIAPKEKIALVGYNGAGKTTLIKLIMRLYDTTAGNILADGEDIRDYSVWDYRNSIGTVFQDFMIFAATVKENVLQNLAEKADIGKVEWALRHSGFAERVKTLEHGLETELTTEFAKDGVNLSGGESQKLAIGRVFYKDAGLIILDEPSSALDPIAEYQLNRSMIEAADNKTVIFISHRLSTTRLADRIIMLENGSIVEQGSHDELLKQNGRYAAMWRAQAGQYIAVD